MAIADYLRKLVELKNQLVSNLQSMGVAADENEKLNTLVPKIMDIETGVDTTDATATAEDIAVGKTAYVNDVKVTGTLVQNVEAEFDTSTGAITSMHIGIPNSVEAIGNSAYQNTIRITSITIPNSVTSIGSSAFSGCTRLASITIPNSVTSIGDHAFYDCTRLASITIPDSVTSIGDYAFMECTSLASITIPDSVTSIGDYAFYDCTRLASITIPNSVTSIGDYAFGWCESLESITIPNSVTSIGSRAFFNAFKLADIYYTGTQEQWNAINKGANWNVNMGRDVSGGTVIHYNYIP